MIRTQEMKYNNHIMVVKRNLFENQRDLFLTTILYMGCIFLFLFFYLYPMYFGGQKHFSFKNQSKFLTVIFGKLTKNIENDTRNRVLETKNFFEKSRKTYFDHHFIYGVNKKIIKKYTPYIFWWSKIKLFKNQREFFDHYTKKKEVKIYELGANKRYKNKKSGK